jgi:hypothetical protein
MGKERERTYSTKLINLFFGLKTSVMMETSSQYGISSLLAKLGTKAVMDEG